VKLLKAAWLPGLCLLAWALLYGIVGPWLMNDEAAIFLVGMLWGGSAGPVAAFWGVTRWDNAQ
jgi:hypothetical protein